VDKKLLRKELFVQSLRAAGGEDHYAAYLANTDGYEVELIADNL
jgi:hypothetical protein